MTINADSIEEYLNTEDIVYISSLPTPEEKESAIFSRITTLPTVQVRVNPGQTETPIKNSIPTYRNLSTDTINNCDLGEKIQIAISEQGGCFNIEDLPEITTIEELLNHLCEVLIRFDTDPNNYLKDDYTILLKTICNSLIHLYLHENEIDYNKASNKPKINNIELVGNKTSQDLSLADANHNHDNLYGTKQEILDLQSQKADKSTTLNGYGITDAYTKTESDDKYETIENVDLLEDIVSRNTEDIEYLEANKANVSDLLSVSGQVSENTEDISNLYTNKADKATTLSGYGITDAYNKTEINTIINNNRTYPILNTVVSTWSASTAYSKYAYEASIPIENLKESDLVEVIYSIPDAESTNYAPGGELYEGYIKIFAKVNTEITIPTLVITKIDL